MPYVGGKEYRLREEDKIMIKHSQSYCYCVSQENRNGKQRLKRETNESSDVLLKKRINQFNTLTRE